MSSFIIYDVMTLNLSFHKKISVTISLSHYTYNAKQLAHKILS